ncbi:hypothetical protein KFU94_65985 [Chloroflexi bacterium TSY]|nr:hypothetical protein [Chloroflexi bacterium TSY]
MEHFLRYIELLDLDTDEMLTKVEIGDSRLDRLWQEQYNGSGRNRVRPWLRFSNLYPDDVAKMNGIKLAPEHYADQAVQRCIPVNEQLMLLLGFCSRRDVQPARRHSSDHRHEQRATRWGTSSSIC